MHEAPVERWTPDSLYGARIESSALRTILDTCRVSGRSETGGILVGRYSEDRRLATIQSASAPAPDSRAGPFWLVRGVRGLHAWLEELWKEDAGYYLGEWHFHPFAAPTPSSQDLKQMRRIATTPSYQCADPLLLIVGGNPNGQWTIHLEVHARSAKRHVLSVDASSRVEGSNPGLDALG